MNSGKRADFGNPSFSTVSLWMGKKEGTRAEYNEEERRQ